MEDLEKDKLVNAGILLGLDEAKKVLDEYICKRIVDEGKAFISRSDIEITLNNHITKTKNKFVELKN